MCAGAATQSTSIRGSNFIQSKARRSVECEEHRRAAARSKTKAKPGSQPGALADITLGVARGYCGTCGP